MSVLTELEEYIFEKLDDHVYNRNTGIMLLKLYPEHREQMSRMFIVTIQVMQRLFTKETSDSPAGTSPLTNMSMKIGQFLFRYMDRTPVNWEEELRLGDLFVEAFYNCGFINIDYPARRDSSHIVRVAIKWAELSKIPESDLSISLQATELAQPPSIRGPNQNGRPILKDGGELDLESTFVKSLDKLQQTGWKINNRVFTALKKEKGFVSDKREKNEAREMKRLSKVVEWKFTKTKANLLKNDKFYQYMSADYRGRLYYDEPFLNFQGSDISRGIMLFAEGKPIDESGNFWLAVHTANSYNKSYGIDEIPEWVTSDYRSHLEDEGLESISVDKFTLEDRATWTQQNIEEIIELGKTCQFDIEAEKKVTFLAACIEWYDYSINPDHLSYRPIGIDGSNNGWQHLGAFSKDPETGKLVGLIPAEIQQDFYVKTAKELIKQTTDERLMEILQSEHLQSKLSSLTHVY